MKIRQKIYLSLVMIIMTIGVNNIQGQVKTERPMYTSNWGHLYRQVDNKDDILGVFSTEASVYLIDSTKTQYRVRMSNDDIGFIDKQKLQKGMFGTRSKGEPIQYFYRGQSNQQCPHFYVQASELRARSLPSTEGKEVRKVNLNEMICVDYVPLYEGGWVYIGDHFHENPEFIQYKYLGRELTYDTVLKAYQKAKNTDQELIQVERLREIGWNSKPQELLQSLHFWKESMSRFNKINPKVDIDLELMLAEKMQNPLEYSNYKKVLGALNMRFLIHGKEILGSRASENDLKQIGFSKINQIVDFPECGWEPIYYYSKGKNIFAIEEFEKGKKFGTAYNIFFEPGVELFLGKVKLGDYTDEKSFVLSFGHLLNTDWIDQPHVYRMANGDAGQFIFTFIGGKLYKFETMYYC